MDVLAIGCLEGSKMALESFKNARLLPTFNVLPHPGKKEIVIVAPNVSGGLSSSVNRN